MSNYFGCAAGSLRKLTEWFQRDAATAVFTDGLSGRAQVRTLRGVV
jgi:hypothetical protein